MNETIPFLPGLSPVTGKELFARFDGGRLSSDGGVLLLREVEHGLAELLASCLADERDPSSTRHSHADMIRARMFAIAMRIATISIACAPIRPSNWPAGGWSCHVLVTDT